MYNIGDTIELTENYPDDNKYLKRGDTGTILKLLDIYTAAYFAAVCFDKEVSLYESTNSEYAENHNQYRHIWLVQENQIKLAKQLTPEEKTAQKQAKVIAKIKYLDKKFEDNQKRKANNAKTKDIPVQNTQPIGQISRNWPFIYQPTTNTSDTPQW